MLSTKIYSGITKSFFSSFSLFKIISFNYDDKVIDHYSNPRNVGSFNEKEKNVGTGLVGAPACGDVMKLQIKVDNKGVIEKAVFKTFGCGSAIASSSYATELIKGKKIEEAINIKNKDIASYLKLPPVKLHCSMLAEEAIKAAVKDYKSKLWLTTLLLAIIMILAGIYILVNSGAILQIVGGIIVTYGVIDVIENFIFIKKIDDYLK